jgi:hypothetical protein
MSSNLPKGMLDEFLKVKVRNLTDTAQIIEMIKPFSEGVRLTIKQLRLSEPLPFAANNPDMIPSQYFQSKIREDLKPSWVCLMAKSDGSCFF